MVGGWVGRVVEVRCEVWNLECGIVTPDGIQNNTEYTTAVSFVHSTAVGCLSKSRQAVGNRLGFFAIASMR